MTAVIMQGVSGGSDQDDSERGGEKWYLKDGTTGFSEGVGTVCERKGKAKDDSKIFSLG